MWEYMTVSKEKVLNDLEMMHKGRHGWELIAVQWVESKGKWYYFFKKRKEAPGDL